MPMSLFAIMALTGPGIGCVASGWIEQDPHLEWRWIQWIHVMYVWDLVAWNGLGCAADGLVRLAGPAFSSSRCQYA